jgi:16S rRNA (guanine527-N7)-methyltransferase
MNKMPKKKDFALMCKLYKEWNEKINVISRRDIDSLYLHHVLHSLAIAKFCQFRPGTTTLDLGTGGGFPGLPLAILFPECRFRLIDGTGKKILVARSIAEAIGLTNCQCLQRRGEEETERFHFVVSRAVMPLPDLVRLVRKNVSRQQINALPNGIICLKGGNVEGEVMPFRNIVEVTPVSDFFAEEWFEGKHVIYLPV